MSDLFHAKPAQSTLNATNFLPRILTKRAEPVEISPNASISRDTHEGTGKISAETIGSIGSKVIWNEEG